MRDASQRTRKWRRVERPLWRLTLFVSSLSCHILLGHQAGVPQVHLSSSSPASPSILILAFGGYRIYSPPFSSCLHPDSSLPGSWSCTHAKPLCLTLCDPVGPRPSGSSVHGILQARILEWVAISFSRRSSQPRDRTWASHIAGRFFAATVPGPLGLGWGRGSREENIH